MKTLGKWIFVTSLVILFVLKCSVQAPEVRVTGEKTALVIYGDKQNAIGFADLLEDHGLKCTIMSEYIAKEGFSEIYDLIITLSCCSTDSIRSWAIWLLG